jgi:hypothetical protein
LGAGRFGEAAPRAGSEGVQHLPSFCRPIIDDETSSVVGVDFWAVAASEDDLIDQIHGEILSDELLAYTRRSGQPEFADLVIVWVTVTRREFGPLERAFIEHVMRNDPRCADRIAALIYSQHSDLRH